MIYYYTNTQVVHLAKNKILFAHDIFLGTASYPSNTTFSAINLASHMTVTLTYTATFSPINLTRRMLQILTCMIKHYVHELICDDINKYIKSMQTMYLHHDSIPDISWYKLLSSNFLRFNMIMMEEAC